MSDPTTVHILLVEDDSVDAEAIIRAFRREKIANPVLIAADGLSALAMLRGDAQTPPVPRPFIILLDLNMPRMNGIEFLTALRQDVALRDSVVFVLTTSNADRDKLAAYAHNVAGYLTKSRVGHDFVHLVTLLGQYWRYVELPPEHTP